MKKILKNKNYIIKFIAFGIMLYFFIVLGTKDFQTNVTDNVRFATEYKDISKNNVFKFVGEHEVMDILNGKSGIIFMGFPSNMWCHYYADYLNEVAISNNISEIYYYDFKRDRSLNNATYLSIVKKIKDYLNYDDVGNMDIQAPTIIIVKNGNVLYFENDVRNIKGDISPKDYFNDYKEKLLKSSFDLAIKEYLKDEQYE